MWDICMQYYNYTNLWVTGVSSSLGTGEAKFSPKHLTLCTYKLTFL